MQAYLFCHGDPESMVDPSGNFSMAEVLTTISIRINRLANQVYRLQEITEKSRTVFLQLQIGLNYIASVESVLENLGSGSFKDDINWAFQTAALFRSWPYQSDMLKKLKADLCVSGGVIGIGFKCVTGSVRFTQPMRSCR